MDAISAPRYSARSLKLLAASAIIVISLTICILANVVFWDFQGTAFADDNPATWENWIFWGGFFFCAAYAVIGLCAVEEGKIPGYWKPFQFVGRKTDGWIGTASAWFLSLALIPVLVIGSVQFVPHTLHTPPDHIRIMDGGTVLAAGQTTVSPRYARSSTLVPAARGVTTRVSVQTPSGLVSLDIETVFQIVPNAAFERSVAGQERSAEHDLFYAKALSRVYAPLLVDVVSGVSSGQRAGDRGSLIIRLGDLVAEHPESVPSWISEYAITDVSVAYWGKG